MLAASLVPCCLHPELTAPAHHQQLLVKYTPAAACLDHAEHQTAQQSAPSQSQRWSTSMLDLTIQTGTTCLHMCTAFFDRGVPGVAEISCGRAKIIMWVVVKQN